VQRTPTCRWGFFLDLSTDRALLGLCARVRIPGAVDYKGEHIRTASGDVLMSAAADSNPEESTYLKAPLFCDEIELGHYGQPGLD